MRRVMHSIRLDAQLSDRIQQLAAESDRSLSNMIEHACHSYVQHVDGPSVQLNLVQLPDGQWAKVDKETD